VVAGKILESKDYAFGYNAQTDEYGDLVKQGVIDPAKVVRTALQGAASVAGLLITTEAMVTELPKTRYASWWHGRYGLLVAIKQPRKATNQGGLPFGAPAELPRRRADPFIPPASLGPSSFSLKALH
jgi:hypothetical protein